jgi:hypothetical protein
MTEPIKLPPDLLTVTLVREGVNKHRAREVEQWMNEKMAQAVEQNPAELRAEVEKLRADAADFHMAYRMKCDEETKAQAVEVERLRAELARLTTQEPVAWMESPHGAIRANPNYKIKFPSQVLGWQIPLYTHLPALLPDVKEPK